jgi:hypothetical protein
MSLLKEVISEMAAGGATTAGAIAGFRSVLGAKASKKGLKREMEIRSRLKPVGNFMTMTVVAEADQTFDAEAVKSKMQAADKKAKHLEDTKMFGLEDENGNVVRVRVASEEADDFETALSHMLHGDDEEESETDMSSMEIAEVLFKLRDRFTIVDVVWPEIEEDEEEDATAANEETLDDAEGNEEGDLSAEEGDLDDEDLDMEADEEGGDEFDQMSMLSQVIDLLKSQQDAAAAEASAKEAEAEAKKAEAEREAAMAKVRQEEQILDMEAYYKNKKEGDKEAKRLAQLARWKHDIAADNSAGMDGVEQEEDLEGGKVNVFGKVDGDGDGKMDPQDFLRYLFKYLGNK